MKNKQIFMIGTLGLMLALGVLATTISQVWAAGDGKVIMWGLARCMHNPNVGLICTDGHSGQGGHPQNR
jgi:hypothetical protein